MKIVFFGTPGYVVPVLENLHKAFKYRSGESPIAAVVTQGPKPTGRKQALSYSEVDHWAHKHKIPKYHKAQEIINEDVLADVGVLASYGEIIPKNVLDHFPYGIVNIHPSLLPKFRGASPVQASIISGETKTGVSFITLDEKLDHGPILSQFKEEVLEMDTTESLRNRLFERSAEILPKLLEAHISGKTKPKAQNHAAATLTTQIKKVDAFINPKYLNVSLQGNVSKTKWNIPFVKDHKGKAYNLKTTAKNLSNFIRAMQPWPIAWTVVKLDAKSKKPKEKRLKILSSHLTDKKLVLDEVQLEGKNPVSWKQFAEAYPDFKFSKN